jgi:hypothetical protein
MQSGTTDVIDGYTRRSRIAFDVQLHGCSDPRPAASLACPPCGEAYLADAGPPARPTRPRGCFCAHVQVVRRDATRPWALPLNVVELIEVVPDIASRSGDRAIAAGPPPYHPPYGARVVAFRNFSHVPGHVPGRVPGRVPGGHRKVTTHGNRRGATAAPVGWVSGPARRAARRVPTPGTDRPDERRASLATPARSGEGWRR